VLLTLKQARGANDKLQLKSSDWKMFAEDEKLLLLCYLHTHF